MSAADALQEAGHIVAEFGTAADAKAYCAEPENPVTAVLTDINMPGEEDGLDLAAYVAGRGRGRRSSSPLAGTMPCRPACRRGSSSWQSHGR